MARRRILYPAITQPVGFLGTVFSNVDKSATLSLTRDSLKITTATNATNQAARGTTSHATGKWYFEATVTFTTFDDAATGIATSGFTLSATPGGLNTTSLAVYPLNTTNGAVFFNNVNIGTLSPIHSGDTYGVAIDFDAKKIYVLAGFLTNGSYTWNNNDGSNPATNVGGISFSGFPSGATFPLGYIFNANETVTANFGASPFVNAPPAGFVAWNTQPGADVPVNCWLMPLAEPVRRQLRNVGIGGTLPLPAVTSVEAVSIDKWLVPLAEPVRRSLRNVGIGGTLVSADPFPENLSVDKWYVPLAEPVRRVLKNVGIGNTLVSADPFPETTSVDKWFAPLALPTRRVAMRGSPIDQGLVAQNFITGAEGPVTVDKWLVPLSEPTRRLRTANVGIAGPILVEASFVENNSIDRWQQPFSEPTRRRVADNVAIAGPSLVQTVFVEAVSIDKWLQPFSEPQRRLPQKNVGIAGPSLVEANFAETTTLDRWYQPLSLPTRRFVPRSDIVSPIRVAPVAIETVTVDKWFRPLAEPTRRRTVPLVGAPPFYSTLGAGIVRLASFDALLGTVVALTTSLTANIQTTGTATTSLSGTLYSAQHAADNRTVNIT